MKIGARLGADLTVLGIVNDLGSEPVYLVWHHKSWCPMACKIFESNDGAQREAEILMAVAHPNIVRCFGVYGSKCLLMEFLEGPTLSQLMDKRPKRRLSIGDAIRVAIHLGTALKHVHETGLLYLDLKPSNAVAVKGRPILCDFGIARWQNAPRAKGVRGTDPYIAPEECLLEEVTPAADVFGLGVTLYQLLTGALPFPDGREGEPYPQVAQAPAPLRRHRAAVPRALEGLVLDCLSRDPSARPQLAMLLPRLHSFIRSGPPMWPANFQPDLPVGEG
jgi:serine/threonine protein kinase